ncbi:MAG: prolyl oligopeptidase family serine peptidase, partial [Planctomycetota bacterium]
LELLVNAHTPRCFIWHTSDDCVVPLANALCFAEALANAKVPCELHVFPTGAHGLGLASTNPTVSQWTTLCAQWFSDLGWRS